MLFQEKFNEVCKFYDPNIEDLDDFNKEIFKGIKKFNEEYEIFKKEHGLENMFFSRSLLLNKPY